MSKGDKPRNCFSKQYRNNYDNINWPKKITRDNIDNLDQMLDARGRRLQSLAPALSGISTDDQVKVSEK